MAALATVLAGGRPLPCAWGPKRRAGWWRAIDMFRVFKLKLLDTFNIFFRNVLILDSGEGCVILGMQ